MTQSYIYNKVKQALTSRYSWYYQVDDLFVSYYGITSKHFSLDLDVFSKAVLAQILRYLDKHGYKYTTTNCTRGGYIGGGTYREFTLVQISNPLIH